VLANLKAGHQQNPDSIETNRALADYYLSHNMDSDAEPYLLKILDIGEETPAAHNQLGMIYFRRGRYAKAMHHLRKVLELDSTIAEAHFNLAFLYQIQEKFSEALSHYKEAMKADPDDPEIYYQMGHCAHSLGMLREAEVFFVESFRITPTAETAMALSILYVSEEKYAEAEDLLSFLLDLVDNNENSDNTGDQSSQDNRRSPGIIIKLHEESLLFALGLVLGKQEKYMEAIERLRKVVMINDRNEQAYNYLGECCAAVGLAEEAESFFAKASKIDDQYLQPIMNLGKLCYHQGQYYMAVAGMERYIKIRSELVDTGAEEAWDTDAELVHEILGKSYLHLDDKTRAMEVWKRSLEMNPDQPELTSLISSSLDPVFGRGG